MDSLPKELYLEIFSHLSHTDQLSVSRVCRLFAVLVKPLLFSVLSFNGNAQNTWYDHTWKLHHYGRKKTVETAYLAAAVDEVIEMEIALYVKTFKFSPAFYVDDFWIKYRRHLQTEIDERDINCDDIPDDMSDGFDDDPEWGYVGVRRVREAMEARPERERWLIEENERMWRIRVAKQEANKEIINAALVMLLKAMPNLHRVEIGLWHIDMKGLEFPDVYYPDKVKEQFSANEIIWSNFSRLASALHTSNQHIKGLHVPCLDTQLCIDSGATTHTVTQLTDLEFRLGTIESLNMGNARQATALASLLICTQPTLQRLKIGFAALESHYSHSGEHTFDDLLCEAYMDTDERRLPLAFPFLENLELSNLIVHPQSLIQFLSHQLALESVYFDRIHLGASGYKWSDVATSLPPSCTSWYVNNCGHEPVQNLLFPAQGIRYNHISEFMPYKEPLLPSTGWKIKDPFCETDPDPKLWYNKQSGQFWLLPSHRARYMTKQVKLMLTEAAYERIDALGEERVGGAGEMNRKRNQAWKRARVPDDLVPPENIFRLPSTLDAYRKQIARSTSELRNVPSPLVPEYVASSTFF